MSMKLMLSAAALVALSATSAMSAPAFLGNPYCEKAISRQACGSHLEYVKELRSRGSTRDSSPIHMKNLDPRENSALRDGGGGGVAEAANGEA